MNFIKGIFTAIGTIVVFGLIFVFVKFDLGTRIEQVKALDPQALPEYMKMFDKVLTTGDPAKGMVRKVKMQIPEGMTKEEAIENAIEVMDSVGEEYGLAMVDTKLMSRGETDSAGVYQPYIRIRSYCSKTIAQIFLGHSAEFIGFMPCRIGIVENKKGEIWLYTMSMELMINGGQPLPPKLLKLANEVRTGMYSMLEKAAKGDED
ncbi:hypothetical protein MNB_SV-6-775 [hydrothermal vent metagenome]|uniref:DUF302 domain-containing protein n=1 Tax=hydrothermal vent metagenome TaxID=652676 RepID=A0A1W1BDJ7_9ZZZZ